MRVFVSIKQWFGSLEYSNIAVAVMVGCSLLACELARHVCTPQASGLYITVAKVVSLNHWQCMKLTGAGKRLHDAEPDYI